MRIIPGIISLSLLWCSPLLAAVYVSNGSSSDVQAKINSATDGDTVQIPAGSFTWSSGVTVSGKGIKIQGGGGGGILGTSTTSTSIGTGSKTFTTQSGLGLTTGQAVTVYVKNVYQVTSPSYVRGTVTSYSGTSLAINVTTTAGSGTHAYWYVTADPSTQIIHSAGGANLITLNADTTQAVEIFGIKFIQGSGSGQHIRGNGGAGSRPMLVHDCWFSTQGNMLRSIEWAANGGIIYRCYFDENFGLNVDEGIVFKPLAATTSWTTTSTMGTRDTDGTANTYVEDCYFANISYSAMDFDDNSRTVVRHCTFDNTGFGSHGQDTSPYGVRHYEVYDNTFIFQDMSSDTVNLNWLFYVRGGTGVICNNTMPNVASSAWGDKGEIVLTLFSIRRGPTQIPCQTSYPASHQIGRGYIDGSGGSKGDLEPLYIWSNGSATVSLNDYQPDECGNNQTISTYVQSGRDYYNGTAKPGWTRYTYPHPLRSSGSVVLPPTAPHLNFVTNNPTGS